jgi:squalene-hopene/tetraprenyl-beta-curcumene cyclase
VKGYFALKLMGDDPESPHMRAGREMAVKLGGVEGCNSFSKFYLAALGQISYDACPTIPPEIVLLPKWLYFNLYAVSAWSRTMILPLALVGTLRPVRKLREEQGIQELIKDKQAANSPLGRWRSLPRSWREMFLLADLSLKQFEKTAMTPLRPRAMREAERWILDHLDGSEGLGAIFPSMVYVLIMFRALGYADDNPRVVEGHRHLRDLFIRGRGTGVSPVAAGGAAGDQGRDARATADHGQDARATVDTIRIQPCFSPVWDTGIAMHALAESGLAPEHPAAVATVDWLLAKECRTASDWAKNCRDVEPSGWYFEYSNPHYPDVDDTAMVCIALKRLGGERCAPAIKRGVNWLLAMQNDDGGWAAFDRTRSRPLLEHVPFADHNAIQDPSCPDITGRVFEGLGRCGVTTAHAAVRRGIDFIRQGQDQDGCWFGRWGVNYIYGTWQCLMGLKAVGERMDHRYIRRAAEWLRQCQKADGSWGESCDSYEDPKLKGIGESTPSQTAWGAMAMMAICGPHDAAVRKAMGWLMARQREDGNWDEDFFTGTGFPRVFYLKYHLYRLYFPLMALGRYKRLTSA